MKKISFAFIVMMILVSCQEQQKFGFVDNGKVINDYQEKLDIEEKYKAKDELFTQRTDSIGKAFQLEAQEFQLKSKSMSQKNAQEQYDALGQKQQLLQQQLQFEQQQLQQAFSAEIDSVIVRVKDFVQDYGEKNGYTYIFGTSDASSTVMYGKDSNDLSQVILDALNAQYKKE